MKGVIFTHLQEMIESQQGFQVWDAILAHCDLPSGGVFVSTERYPDDELFAIVTELSVVTNTPINDLLGTFGEYLFVNLHKSMSPDVFAPSSLWDLLKGLDSIIHMEVKKLDKKAQPPTLIVKRSSDHEMVLEYRSTKKLCYLAMGMLKSAANMFAEEVTLTMPVCIHDGHDYCELVITRHV
ncbi:heme NO-binding domain-containing protein [Pseudomonadales bacterium]|nr:heme NO-binding domain-containing protein [Pseudomonadales bacterium]